MVNSAAILRLSPEIWATPLKLDHGNHCDKLEYNITKMPREKRKFSPDFKAQVVMQACKGLDTVHTIAAKYEVHPVQVSTWKK